MVNIKETKNFTLILGQVSTDLFDYFEVDEMHGFSRAAAEAYPETKEDAYIMGLTNYAPTFNMKPFIFFNVSRFDGSFKDYTAIMHEAMHLTLLLNNWDIALKEEQIVAQAEIVANNIIETILNEKNTNLQEFSKN